MRWGSAAPLLGAALLVAGCAKPLPPPGGPVDTTPPVLASSSPASGTARAGRVSSVTLVFDEPMDKSSVRDWTFVSPSPGPLRWSFEGPAATLTFAESLSADRTYTVLVGPGATDRRGMPLGRAVAVRFATGATLDSHAVAGRIVGRATSPAGAFVLLDRSGRLAAAAAGGVDGVAVQEIADYVGLADGTGRFAVPGLPTGTYTLAALADRNKNRAFDRDRDLLTVACDSIVLGAGRDSIADVVLGVGDPEERPSVTGTVRDSLVPAPRDSAAADSARRALRRLTRLELAGDTTLVAPVDSTGAFRIEGLEPGRYRLRAFVDSNANGRPDGTETASDPVPLCLTPAETRAGVVLVLRGR